MGHFKTNTLRSVCGDPLVRLARGKDHFLFRLDKIIDWQECTPKLVEAYKGKACRGECPYHPPILFKMLLLAHLLNTSERAIEEQCNWVIPVRLFVGLGIHDAVPDHSTLTLFKRRLQKHDGIGDFKFIFDGIIRQALAKGVKFGSIQIVDLVHTVANVNNDKDRERHEQGKPSADPDATVVHKGKRLVTKANGVVEQRELMHLGYKTHVSQDAATGIVTSIKPTTGSSGDNHQMADLIDNDTKLGVTANTYTADKGYDDGELHTKLQSEGKHSALMLKKVRTEKKNENREQWVAMLNDPFYQAGVKVRYRIERTFGEAKLPGPAEGGLAWAWPREIHQNAELQDTILYDFHGPQLETNSLAANRGEVARDADSPRHCHGLICRTSEKARQTGAARRPTPVKSPLSRPQPTKCRISKRSPHVALTPNSAAMIMRAWGGRGAHMGLAPHSIYS